MHTHAFATLFSPNWHDILVPSGSLVEVIIRGTLMYLLIVAAFRVFRRDAGSMSISDILVVVLIADAAQNGMAGEYKSLTEGVTLAGTIFAWNYSLDWLAFHNRFIYWLLHPPPLLLIDRGRLQFRNLRAQLITGADLREQLREQGVENLAAVKACWLEGDGRLSIVKMDAGDAGASQPQEKRT